MKQIIPVGVLMLWLMAPAAAWSQFVAPNATTVCKEPLGIDETKWAHLHHLKGRIVDHTTNHGKDNRIWARSMFGWRDLYIYLPPAYDPEQQYPFMIFLHPFVWDERFFLHMIPLIDDAIYQGKLPPLIIAAPDGSFDGKGSLHHPGSFFLNSGAGSFEDFVLQDVWDFVTSRYPIRPERCAHVLAGASMGGYAAFNFALRHREAFGAVIGIHPMLNMRWMDVDGNPYAKFNPHRWAWRTSFEPAKEIMATYLGVAHFRTGQVLDPVFGFGNEGFVNIACNNPLELLINTRYRNGELAMFVGYGGRDEWNVDAQVESFLYYAKFKGIGVAVAFEPEGRHDTHTAKKLLPAALEWLGPHIAPYAPEYKGKRHINARWPATGAKPGPIESRYPMPGKASEHSIDTRFPSPGNLTPGPAILQPQPPPPHVSPFTPRWPAPEPSPRHFPPPPRYVPTTPFSVNMHTLPQRWPGMGY